MPPSRRRFLVTGTATLVAGALAAGGGYELVEHDVLPGRIRLARMLGRCGGTPPPPRGAVPYTEGTFHSRRRGRRVRWVRAGPAAGVPTVIVLHGLGGDARSLVTDLAAQHYLHAAIAGGERPMALVGVDGGGTYWHRRSDGDDPLGMITDELLPRLATHGWPDHRFGVLGYSMGGFGALLLAQRLGSARVAAVVAESPAIFASYAAARGADPGAFDGPRDFARHDVTRRAGRLHGIPLWLGCGRDDVFAGATEGLRHRLAELGDHPMGGIGAGCHDMAYWRRMLPAQLAFLGTHLG